MKKPEAHNHGAPGVNPEALQQLPGPRARSWSLLQRRGSRPFPGVTGHTQTGPGKEMHGQQHHSVATDYFPERGGQAIPEGKQGTTWPLNISAPKAQRPTQKTTLSALVSLPRHIYSHGPVCTNHSLMWTFYFLRKWKLVMTSHHHREGEETDTNTAVCHRLVNLILAWKIIKQMIRCTHT